MNGIDTGYIINRIDRTLEPYIMVRLDKSHCSEIIRLQNEITSKLEVSDIYVSLSEQEITEIMDGAGLMIGIRVQGRLIAFCSSLSPGSREDNLGRDIGLPMEELDKVIHLEAAVVEPMYRGNSLQKKMAGFIMKEIRREERWRYVMNTVSPLNTSSLATTFSLGLIVKKLEVKYNGLLRYIFFKDFMDSINIDLSSILHIPATDFIRQRELLAAGCYGFDINNAGGSTIILYGREVSK